MIKLLPECSRCGSTAIDSLETEIEQHGKVKTGHYIDGIGICHDCLETEEGKKRNKGGDHGSYYSTTNQCGTMGVADASDVSPNTPAADET